MHGDAHGSAAVGPRTHGMHHWQPRCSLMPICVQAKRTMREADTNGDGMVSKEEFVQLLLGSPVSDSLDTYDARIARK
jgi:EF hand